MCQEFPPPSLSTSYFLSHTPPPSDTHTHTHLLATINIVPKEEIWLCRREASKLKQAQQVIVLTMHIAWRYERKREKRGKGWQNHSPQPKTKARVVANHWVQYMSTHTHTHTHDTVQGLLVTNRKFVQGP